MYMHNKYVCINVCIHIIICIYCFPKDCRLTLTKHDV